MITPKECVSPTPQDLEMASMLEHEIDDCLRKAAGADAVYNVTSAITDRAIRIVIDRYRAAGWCVELITIRPPSEDRYERHPKRTLRFEVPSTTAFDR
jgi:hypothetical protein